MKQDDRGVSLVEILIATAILVICVVPPFILSYLKSIALLLLLWRSCRL